jgi:hypothetical protein
VHFSADAVAGFVGVVTGGVLTGGFQFALAAHSERREWRGAAKLIHAELVRAHGLIEVYWGDEHDQRPWPELAERLGTTEWEMYGATLARGRRFEYGTVVTAYVCLGEIKRASPRGQMPEDMQQFLNEIQEAIDYLAAVSTHWRAL